MMKDDLLKVGCNYVANGWAFITRSTCLYGWYMYIMKKCQGCHDLTIRHGGKLSISLRLHRLRLSSYYGDTQVIEGKGREDL